ncbi:hypothetical protein [Mycoplasmopsis synoviae]|uniref:Uncharacterized protein n=1 Tax=Mycoplasmopsis synoviae TaxID=2109 RepID=A0AAN1EDW3_MYCSY|nr:hypothetical protein [Mycoplasmopsis synoviae]AKJ20907.1 Type III restriction-modification system methylation subunit [Mycoplasmopsis synoviae]AQU48232.1 Type III restriction-modification system methylation subunit [Mycoplasmopsis synoviae]AWL84443.1 hypothetical protein MSH_03545 [Mycoplasmopsis synoviae]UZF64308.1 hypothetical protein N0B76_03570 [Mycoplasmopsis synoviae]UZF64979.1 hypothetical protein N0B75_03570 [Mycoplasmopsis synoviae]
MQKENWRNFSKASLNKEQKELIIETLEHYSLKENCTEAKLKNLYSLLIQRVKVAFTFDTTPEIINNTISYLEKMKAYLLIMIHLNLKIN